MTSLYASAEYLRHLPDLMWPCIPVLMTSNHNEYQVSSNHAEEISFTDSSKTKFEDHFAAVDIVSLCALISYINQITKFLHWNCNRNHDPYITNGRQD